jgi:hypothetical protein
LTAHENCDPVGIRETMSTRVPGATDVSRDSPGCYGRTGKCSRLRDHRLLLTIAIIGPLCEAVPLRYFHVTAGLAPQVTALTPFAAFHDLRWLLVFHRSWTGFALGLAALIAIRSLFHASMVWAAWPPTLQRPAFNGLLLRALGFTVVVVIVLLPPAVLVFDGGATSLSWLALAALPLFLVVALLLSHGGVGARWWARLPSLRSLGWVALTFVELNLAAAAILLGPWWIAWLSAALAGLFNAWAWQGLVRSVAFEAPPPRPIPVMAMAFAGLFLVAAPVSGWQVHLVGRLPSQSQRSAHASLDRGRIPVLIAGGFDSTWDGRPEAQTILGSDFEVWRFSYRGSDSRGYPLPYTRAQTHQSLGQLEVKMDREVRWLSSMSGETVRIVAASEGSVVARSYLQAFPHAPVSELVMVSPLVEPGRVYYPPEGHEGWGVAAGTLTRALSAIVGGFAHTDLDPDMPFLRSIVDHAPALRTGMLCPAPQARVVAFLPIASAATIPPVGQSPLVPVRTVNGFHGAGITPALQYLATGRLPAAATGAGVLNRVLRSGATAWMVPELPAALNPAWPKTKLTAKGCPVDGWPAPAR